MDLTPIPGGKNGFNPFFSPDGKWIAFTADQKLKRIPITGGQPQVLADAEWGGGTWGSGDTIIYTPHFAVTPATGGSLSTGKPALVYDGRFDAYDVAPDGRMLILRRDPAAPAASIHIVLNWLNELKAKFAPR